MGELFRSTPGIVFLFNYLFLCLFCMWSRRSASGQDIRGGSHWTGDRNTPGFGYSEKQVTIAVDSAAGSKASEVKPVKEVPLWLAHSTVDSTDFAVRQLQQPLVL